MSSDNEESVDQGSGWGWGWLSEAAKVAKTAYESNVKPALQSMEQATSEFGTCTLISVSTRFSRHLKLIEAKKRDLMFDVEQQVPNPSTFSLDSHCGI